MAKTILEDISAFIAQQNAWATKIPTDLEIMRKSIDDAVIFVADQMFNKELSTDKKIFDLNFDIEVLTTKLNTFLIQYNKQNDAIKSFITKHKGEYLIETKSIRTRLEKEHQWVVRELTGAAEDRVDIRQELGYEIDKRRSQDNVINTKIESEITDRINKQNALKKDLESSIAATNLNVTDLMNKLNTEIQDRISSNTTTLQAVSNESTARINDVNTINGLIESLSNNLTVEASTRYANDNLILTSFTNLRTELLNIVTEIETRRVSDLSILSARDNLEENESKKRDYNLNKFIFDLFSDAPLKNFQDGVNDWDTPNYNTANTTSTNISAGAATHGLLSNTIRKLNVIGKFVQGSDGDVYNTDTFSSTNNNVGLDYWGKSNFRTRTNNLWYYDPATSNEKSVINVTSTEIKFAKDYTRVVLGDGNMLALDSATKKVTFSSDANTIEASNATLLTINTSTGVMKAKTFDGTATSALYADLAERYLADAVYEEGTVLAIGGDNEVTLYQPHMPLAGVVSMKPAYRMNDNIRDYEDGYEEYNAYNPFVALKGRIPVKVIGRAKKGEFILAEHDGYAMPYDKLESFNDQKRLIGIALSESKNGIVEVKV